MTNRGNVPTTLDNIRKHRNLDKHGMSHDLYQAYLRSQHWIVTKQEFYNSELFNGECGYCKDRFKKYHVHHKNYSKIGEEPLTHLIALCPKCHNDVHKFLYHNKYNKTINLENALVEMDKYEKLPTYKSKEIRKIKSKELNLLLEELYKLPLYESNSKAQKRIKKFLKLNEFRQKSLLGTWEKTEYVSDEELHMMREFYKEDINKDSTYRLLNKHNNVDIITTLK